MYFVGHLDQGESDLRAIKALVQQLAGPSLPSLSSSPLTSEPLPASSSNSSSHSSSPRSSHSSSNRSSHSSSLESLGADNDGAHGHHGSLSGTDGDSERAGARAVGAGGFFQDVDLEAGESQRWSDAGPSGQTQDADRTLCLICYEDFPLEEKPPRLPLPALHGPPDPPTRPNIPPAAPALPPRPSPRPACPHSFCRKCVVAYLETRMREGRTDFPCPMRGDADCRHAFR